MSTTPALRSSLWRSTLVVVGLALLAKMCGAFKEVAMAKYLGTSQAVDQFVFAFTIATWPAGLATSVLVIALTPLLAKMPTTPDVMQQRFMAQLWGASLALSLLLGVLLAAVFPWLSPVAQAGGTRLALMVGVVCFLSCMAALMGVILMSRSIQVGTLLEGLPSLVLGLLLVAGLWQASTVLIYGVVLGMVLQAGTLWLIHRRQARAHAGTQANTQAGAVSLAWTRANPHWKTLAAGLGYTTAGYAVHATVTVVDLAIASHLAAGSVASLSYAGRINALAMGLIATAVHRVAIVHFCKMAAQPVQASYPWLRVLVAFVVGSLAVSALLIVFANPIVTLLYQRGQFDAQATQTVAQLMRWGVASLAPYVATAVLCAYLSANGRFKQIFLACCTCFTGHMVVLALGTAPYGLTAIVAAPLFGHLAMLSYLLFVVLKRPAPVAVAAAA
jgi:putative peptidoglycan lipid II flippase